MEKIIVGIDPDIVASGVAVLDVKEKSIILSTKSFGELVSYFQCLREITDLVVVVEAGWLNKKASWHCNPHESNNVSAKKGLAVGRNQQVGHDIADLCRVYGLKVVEQAPLKKCWQGKDGKISHDEFKMITGITKKRTNQEERDAGLLAWCYSNLPIRIKLQSKALK